MKRIKVKLPQWWVDQGSEDKGRAVYGYTDGVATYCSSATPCYYVEVPEFEYEGYFGVADLNRGAK